jgi:putative peptide zinc metalloprotease protein
VLETADAAPAETTQAHLWRDLQAALPEGASAAPAGLWAELKLHLDVAQARPAQAPGVVARELRDRTGPYFVLKNPAACTYLRLSPREYWLWQRLDGTRSVQDLVVAYFLAHGTFAFALIVGLVQQLYHQRLLRDQPQYIFAGISQALSQRSLAYKLMWPARALLTRQWAIGHLDGLLARLYRSGGWLFFTLPAQLAYFLVSAVGLFLLTRILADQRFQLGGPNLGLSVVTLWVVAILPVIIHELGHALTVKHYSREVHSGGLMLYYGMPAAFVDTTDIWMEGKGARLAVTWAGPYTGFVIGGACAILVWLRPGLAIAPLLLQTAVIASLTSVLNLNPLLKLDGYYLLSDALEIPRLRERSLAFVQHKLAGKLLKRERLTRDELIFVVFGALSALWTVYVIYVSLIVWNARVVDSLRAIVGSRGDLGALALNVLLIGLALSFLTLIGFQLFRVGRAVAERARRAGLFDGPGRTALGLISLATAFTFGAWLAGPAAGGLVSLVLGVAALLASLYLTLQLTRGFAGAPAGVRSGLAFSGALSLALAAHILWAVPLAGGAAAAASLDLAALALGAMAELLNGRLLAGLGGSWRAWSALLLVGGGLGLAGVVAAQAGGVPQPSLLLAHLWAALLLAAGCWHWSSFRQPRVAARPAGSRALTTAERLWDSFELLAASVISQARAAYGRGAARRLQAQFNAAARSRHWGLQLAGDDQVFTASETLRTLPVADQAELLAAALTALLDEAVGLAGRGFAAASLARGYDALDWHQRETAEDHILHQVRWARGLAEQFQVAHHDLEAVLAHAPLFVAFTPEELRTVIARLHAEHYAQGAELIRQGEPGDRFYLVRRGRLEVFQQDEDGLTRQVNELVRGDYFGEAALLANAPRNATVRAATPVEVLSLGKADFDQLVRAGFEGRAKMDTTLRRVGLLRRIPIFKEFESFELQLLAARLEALSAAAGETVVAQGDPGDRFYLIESGEVAIRLRLPGGQEVEQARRGAGEYFGEIALLMDVPRTASVVAVRPTRLLALGAADFQELVRDSLSLRRGLERLGSGSLLQNAQLISGKVTS